MLQNYVKPIIKASTLTSMREEYCNNVWPLKTPTGQIVTTDNITWPTHSTHLQFSVHPWTTEQHFTFLQICRPTYVGLHMSAYICRPTYVGNTEVEKKLNHLNINKSIGPDLRHPRILQTLKDILYGPLNHIFNKSAETGILYRRL